MPKPCHPCSPCCNCPSCIFPLWYIGSDVGGPSPCPVGRSSGAYVHICASVCVGARICGLCLLCVSLYMCMRGGGESWVPTAEPVMVVPCPALYPAGWGSCGLWGPPLGAGPRMRRQRQEGQAELAPCFMHNCWCESQIRVVGRRAVRAFSAFGDTSEIGTCRALFLWTLIPQPRLAEFRSGVLVLHGCRCQLALRRCFVLDGQRIEPAPCARLPVGTAVVHDVKHNQGNLHKFALCTSIMDTCHPSGLDDLIYSRQVWYHSFPLSLPSSLCVCARLYTQAD